MIPKYMEVFNRYYNSMDIYLHVKMLLHNYVTFYDK